MLRALLLSRRDAPPSPSDPPPPPRYLGQVFDPLSLSDKEYENMFRFRRHEVEQLLPLLSLPNPIRLPSGGIVEAELGLLIFLRRMSYPNRLCDLSRTFYRDESEISRISRQETDFLYIRLTATQIGVQYCEKSDCIRSDFFPL